MSTSSEIKQRANALAEKTDVNSITPKEVGSIMYDLASHSENVLRNGGTLGIRKVYESVAAMEADSTNPIDIWGNPIKKGNLVVIYDGTTTGVDNNKIYAFMNPGWQIATHLDAGYATKAETDAKLAELGSKQGFTDNEELNKILSELVLPESKAGLEVVRVVISDGYELEGKFYNTIRLYFTDDTILNLYSKSFDSLAEANADIAEAKIVGSDTYGYAVFKSIGLNNQKSYPVTFNRPLTIAFCPFIKSYLNEIDYDTKINSIRINVSEKYPNDGVDKDGNTGGNRYDLLNAINKVPVKCRKINLIVDFIDLEGEWQSYQYIKDYNSADYIRELNWCNLLTSKISLADSNDDANIDITTLFNPAGYISNTSNRRKGAFYDLTVEKSAGFSSMVLRVKAGDKFTLNNIKAGSANGRVYGIYDIEGNILSYAEEDTISAVLNIEKDGYIIFNRKTSDGTIIANRMSFYKDFSHFLVYGLVPAINNVRSQINNLYDKVSDLNSIFTETGNLYTGEYTSGYISNAGVLTVPDSSSSAANATVSAVIPVIGGKVYSISGRKESAAIRCFDVNGDKMKILSAIDGSQDWYLYSSDGEKKVPNGQFRVPNNAISIQFGIILYKTVSEDSNNVVLELVGDEYDENFVPSEFEGFNTNHRVIKEDFLPKLSDIPEVEHKKEIKVLCFGNSFTQDSMSYVPFILKNIAPDVELTLGIAYIGGCPLVQHCVNFTNMSMTLGSTTYNVKDYSLQKYKVGATKWNTEGSMNVDALLSNEDWDIITFQQNGTNSDSDWDTYYAPYIFKIHKALAEKVTKPIKLGWLSVHGSYKSTFESLLEKWQGTVENTQKVQSLTGNEVVFPFGTAIQNLRTTPLVNLGDGGFLMGDSAHIHEGIGCLAAAYVNALKIAELAGCDKVSIIGEKTRPTKEWCTSIGVPSPNYGETTNDVVGISENNCYTAQIAAIMAVKKPFEVTDCSVFYNE